MVNNWRRARLPIFLFLVLGLACYDGLSRWYFSKVRSVEIVVVNDSERVINYISISLPPQRVQLSDIQPGEIATTSCPRVDPGPGWMPDQTGQLINGTKIIGNNVNSPGMVLSRVVYIVRKDGTVYASSKGGR
jgi:hypothetical protein